MLTNVAYMHMYTAISCVVYMRVISAKKHFFVFMSFVHYGTFIIVICIYKLVRYWFGW